MAVRKIEFTVSSDGITPSVKQFAGVQGDHKATEVVFNIAPELYWNLKSQANNGAKLIYRFDGYDGEGGFKSSDTAELTEMQLSYELEKWLTRFGGIVRVVLVISALKDDLTEMELYSFPALLQLKNLPEGSEPGAEGYESMSTLAQVAKDSANTAVEAKNIAVEAQGKTELARAALENGTAWVFDGGDAAGNVDLDGDGTPDVNTADIKFVVDGEMSDASENAVMNKVVKAYVDDNIEKLNSSIKEFVNDIVEQGTSGAWTYRKWASGIAECWGEILRTTSNWGASHLFSGGGIFTVVNEPFPFEFTSVDSIVANSIIASNAGVAYSVCSECLASQAAVVNVHSNHSGTQTCQTTVCVKGRWK